ncbi:MAG: Rne/Rng family ribonuclease, partial [Salinibacterium amurskyense]
MVNESDKSKEVPKKKGLFGRILPSSKAAVEKPVAQTPQVETPAVVEAPAATPAAAEAPAAAREPRAAKSSQRPAAKTASQHLGLEVPDAVTGMKADAATSDASAAKADKKPDSEAPARSRSRKSTAPKKSADDAKAAKATKAPAAALTPTSTTSLLFQAPDLPDLPERAPRSRNDNGSNGDNRNSDNRDNRDSRDNDNGNNDEAGNVRRRSRRRSGEDARPGDESPNTVVRVRQPRKQAEPSNEPTRVKGSTRLEAKKQRRRDGRDAGRRRPVVTESEFLARR